MSSSSLRKVGDVPMISAHQKAPLFNTNSDEQQLLFHHAITEVTSSTFGTSPEGNELVRQTGFVNMWFFLRFIASYSGPYDLINADLHLDMCNFYQMLAYPGMKGAGFLFRGGYKSSVWTHGGNSWDMLRDPNVEIILASNIYSRSLEFLEYSQVTYKDNELFSTLYPEYHPNWGARHAHWNKEEMILPNKTRAKNRPNLIAVAVGGSVQGMHSDVLKIDDLIGEHQMNAQRMGGAEFEKAANWAKAAMRNIPRTNKGSRIFICGTRYGPNDAYTWIWDDIGSFYGCTTEEPYKIKNNGEWALYYRAAREMIPNEGYRITMPEKWSNEELDKIAQDDPWTYATQIQNRSTFGGLSEFSDYSLKDCTLDSVAGQYVIHRFKGGQMLPYYLSDMDLIIACDPAGMSKGEHVSNSKYGITVYARDWDNNRYVLETRTDFGPPSKWLPILWDMFDKYRRSGMRCTIMETIGPFSILKDWVREEQIRRGQSINLRTITKQHGDKISRIRVSLQTVLDAGKLYATKQAAEMLQPQIQTFPNGAWLDLLDAVSMAEVYSIKPSNPDYDEDDELTGKRTITGMNRYTGY